MLRATLLQLGSPCPPSSASYSVSLSRSFLHRVLLCNVAHSCMLQSTADALDDDEDAGSSFECASGCVSVSLCVRLCVSLCVVMRARKCVAALGATPTRTSSNCCPLLHCWAALLALWGGPRLCSARLDSTRLAPRPNVKIIVKGN